MAASNGQRVGAFFLALLFLLTTIGATVYVIWQIRQSDSGIVNDTVADSSKSEQSDQEAKCGQKSYDAVEPMSIPTTTTASTPITELQTIDISEGDGTEVQAGDCVAALYYGTLATDGTKFDENYTTGKPIEFSLNGVIDGWKEGIPGMKVGGVRRLLIPSAQGYGEAGAGDSIPPNSDLVFEVKIVGVRQAQ